MCAVGFSNFDDWSFETNDEITFGILDPATAYRFDAVFEKYVPRCEEIDSTRGASAGCAQTEDNAFYMLNEPL